MRRAIAFGCFWLFANADTRAYEVNTHIDLSQSALRSSVLNQASSGVLTDLGLPESIDVADQFSNSSGVPRSILQLLGDGTKFEDNFPRALNHFYDPVNKRPLNFQGVPLGSASPDWAIDGTGDPDTTKFSFKAAREYLLKALTDPSESFRRKQFRLLFESLGHVIHHPQDMAQPQHVRNDAHLVDCTTTPRTGREK